MLTPRNRAAPRALSVAWMLSSSGESTNPLGASVLTIGFFIWRLLSWRLLSVGGFSFRDFSSLLVLFVYSQGAQVERRSIMAEAFAIAILPSARNRRSEGAAR